MSGQDAGQGQGELLPSYPAPASGPGPLEQALAESVKHARLDGVRWAAAVAAARAGARALDRAETGGKPQTTAQLLPRYLDTLARLGLLPEEGADSGGIPLAGEEGSGSDMGAAFGGLSVVGGAS